MYTDPTGHSFWDKVKDFFKEKVIPAIISEVAVFATALIFGGPAAAFSAATLFAATAAAAATLTLDTGEGRQLISRIGHEFFDDVLGLKPGPAHTLSSMATHAAVAWSYNAALNALYYPHGPPETNTSKKNSKALDVNVADGDPPVEVYYRGLEGKNGQPHGLRLHPFMRDWERTFYELENVGGKIQILQGKITDMSRATQNYWLTNPKPDKIFDVYGSKFKTAVDNYRDLYGNTAYNIVMRNSRHFVNYAIDKSK